ncbi:MAG: hypothetical protein QOJ60_1884 [Actinomycetota bacterium]|nr:hypothetical protein [Actinomycetota bacterium]
MRSSKITGVLAAALLIGWSGIGPAAAHPADQGTFDYIETSTVDCGSIQLSLTVEDAGWFVATRHGGDLYYTTHETRTETAVNTANGKTMLVVIRGLFSKDQQIVHNADGTTSITDISPARLVAYAPDGSPAYVASGLERFTMLFDADGNFLGLLSDAFYGHLTWPGLCDAAVAVLS